MWDMAQLEGRMRALSNEPRTPRPAPHLTEAERERIHTVRKIEPVYLDKYSLFLSQKNTGIFKLFPDIGCVSKIVVSISDACARFVPLSSSFTFRTNNYSDEVYHDIYFKDEQIISNSFFSQGVFVAVGDEPIENIDLSHAALKYLDSFQPAVDTPSAIEHAKAFNEGVEANGYRYVDHFSPKENQTYFMRMLAYRLGNTMRPITNDTPMSEMMFHSLALDKRVDIVVLFRILNRDENSGLTIVWKELSRAEAGKIKFAKNEPRKDFRPDLRHH